MEPIEKDDIGRCFCQKHHREICHECCLDFEPMNRDAEERAGLRKARTPLEIAADDKALYITALEGMQQMYPRPAPELFQQHREALIQVEEKLKQFPADQVQTAVIEALRKHRKRDLEMKAMAQGFFQQNPGETTFNVGGPETQKLYDELVAPPSIAANEDEDDCPLCLERMPALTWKGTERHRSLCCGKQVCSSCYASIISHTKEYSDRLRNPELPVEHVMSSFQQLISLRQCPMCRTELPLTSEDRFRLVQANAERNKPWAHCKLGQYLLEGTGTPVNPTEAVKYLRLAAEQGDFFAQHQLGICFLSSDLVEAKRWFEKAVAQGLATSQYQLAQILSGRRGPGVPLNIPRACLLLEHASEQGLPEAQCDLAYAYEHGEGVRQSLETSIYWNRKAAEQGNTTAQANLAGNLLHQAGLLNNGQAMSAGPEALYWARKSVAGGYTDAKSLVDQLEAAFQHTCALCHNKGKLLSCGRCKAASYCSKEHQKEHWQVHKKHCFDVKAADEEYRNMNKK